MRARARRFWLIITAGVLLTGAVGLTLYSISSEIDAFYVPADLVERGGGTVGERAEIGDYEVEFAGTSVVPFADRTERTATMNVYRDGKLLETMAAWQAIYPSFRMLSTRAAIRSTPVEDLYILYSDAGPDGRVAAFRLLVNPLVWWMWAAGPLFIAGTMLAISPRRRTTRIPRMVTRSGQVTTS